MCGASPAHRVEASLALWNVAEADQPTGIILADDACLKHQADVVDILQEHCVEMLAGQAPLHAKAIAAGARRDKAEGAMRSIKPALDAQRSARAAKPDADVDEKLITREGELAEEIAAAEKERLDALTQGTKASDAIIAKMAKAFKAKKK
jgi:hypothetical protein